MTYSLHITVPGLPKTPNARLHWAAKMKEARKWRQLVCMAAITQRPNRPLIKASISFFRYSTHALDYDNLVASFKNPLDGLKDARVIADDNFKTIGASEYKWVKSTRKNSRIEIIVTERAA